MQFPRSGTQTSPGDDVRVHRVLHRGAVAGISIASADLLLHIEPLPLEQLILHDVATVCSWPHAARGEHCGGSTKSGPVDSLCGSPGRSSGGV